MYDDRSGSIARHAPLRGAGQLRSFTLRVEFSLRAVYSPLTGGTSFRFGTTLIWCHRSTGGGLGGVISDAKSVVYPLHQLERNHHRDDDQDHFQKMAKLHAVTKDNVDDL